MASVIALLDVKGRQLLYRDYRGDVDVSLLDEYPFLLLQTPSGTPIIQHKGVSFISILYNDVYLVALTRVDASVFDILVFLSQLVNVLEDRLHHLNEDGIKDNFSVIYELLDEMMDFGIPQLTDGKVLDEYITQDPLTLNSLIKKSTKFHSHVKQSQQDRRQQRVAPATQTNTVSWRKEGIKYYRNEAFLDVIESIDMLINGKGQLLSSEIFGTIRLRNYLTGMPELQLGLNDKFVQNAINSIRGIESNSKQSVEIEDVKFHQCVRLPEFEDKKIIKFIPPDGEFDLATYRVHSDILKPLFLVDYKFKNHSNSRLEIMVKIKANFKAKLAAHKIELKIPVPSDIDSPKFHYNKGKLKYMPTENYIRWKFHKIEGGKEYVMVSELMLPSIFDESSLQHFRKVPINVKFEMQGLVTSGLQVKYLKIQEPTLDYKSYPYVRYITKSGDHYEIRSGQYGVVGL